MFCGVDLSLFGGLVFGVCLAFVWLIFLKRKKQTNKQPYVKHLTTEYKMTSITVPLGVYIPCCMEPPGSKTGALKSATADKTDSKLKLPGIIPLLGLGFSGM